MERGAPLCPGGAAATWAAGVVPFCLVLTAATRLIALVLLLHLQHLMVLLDRHFLDCGGDRK